MGHPILRTKARKVERREINTPAMQQLVDDMLATMHEYRGIGLAAPQVHQDLRLFIAVMFDTTGPDDSGTPIALFNPELAVHEGALVEDWEGCLSIPNIRGLVPRAREITVTGLDRTGNRVELRATDLSARVIQHEYDHIDGVLFLDRMRSLQSLAYVEQRSHSAPAF